MISVLPIIRLAAALLIGAGCAVYAPFDPFSFSVLTIVQGVAGGTIGFLCTFGLQGKLNRRLLRFTVPLSFVLALSFVFGEQLQTCGSLYVSFFSVLMLLGLWALSFLALCHLFVNVPVWLKPKRTYQPISNRRLLWFTCISFCILASAWLLAFYPIITNYDIITQVVQIARRQYNTHHSLLYTLFIQKVLTIATMAGLSSTLGFLMVGLLQMLSMAIAVGYGLVTLNTAGADRRAVIAGALYYCLFPLFGYFAFSTTKDTLFSVFLLLSAIEIYRFSRNGTRFWGIVRLVVFGVLTCMLRFNGMATLALAFIGIAVYLLVYLARRTRPDPALKYLAILLPLILLLYTGASTALVKITGAETPNTIRRDMISLPLQQLARVLTVTDNAEDAAKIESLFSAEDVKALYTPYIADPVKALLIDTDENFAAALTLWLRLSVRYPVIYLEALLENTRGAWYIDDLSHTKMDCWTNAYGYLELDQEYGSGDVAYPVAYHSVLPSMQAFLKRMFNDNAYLDVPLLRYFFALAVQTWIVILALFYAAYHRRPHAVRMLLFALCVLLPIFLLPRMISRYFLPLFLLNPLCLLALTARKENAA